MSNDCLNIRAAQGHSTKQVNIQYQEQMPLSFYIMVQQHVFLIPLKIMV